MSMSRPSASTERVAATSIASRKLAVDDLAIFGGRPVVPSIRSASNLVQPDQRIFFHRLQASYGRDHWVDGPNCRELERQLADRHDVEHCVAFCNGLWAIAVTLDSVKLPDRQEVVMPSMTYRRLGDIGAWAGLTPRYCDISPDYLAATPATIDSCIHQATAALLIAHPIVHLCDVEAIQTLARQRGVPLVFDAVEAAFATWNGRPLGSFGNAECYSLHASKFLNGFEGGYVTTNDGTLAEQLRHRRSPPNGARCRGASLAGPMHEAHAAMALASVADADAQVDRNRVRHCHYRDALNGIAGLRLVQYDEVEQRTYKNTLVELLPSWPLTREQTIEVLHAENLLVRAYYSPPLHRKDTGYAALSGNLPMTDLLSEKYLLLPSGDFLDCEEIARISALLGLLQQRGREIVERLRPQSGMVSSASSADDACEPQGTAPLAEGGERPRRSVRVSRSSADAQSAPSASTTASTWRDDPEDTLGPRPTWRDVKSAFECMFRRRYYTNHGPLVQQLEAVLAERHGRAHAIAVTNETVGLIIAMRTLWPQNSTGAVASSWNDYSVFRDAALWALVDLCPIENAQARNAGHGPRLFATQVRTSLDCNGTGWLRGIVCSLYDQDTDAANAVVALAQEYDMPSLLFAAGNSLEAQQPPQSATVLRLTHEPHAAAAVLTDNDALAAKIRNMRSSYGAGKPARIPLTGNARMSEAQAALALLNLNEQPLRY